MGGWVSGSGGSEDVVDWKGWSVGGLVGALAGILVDWMDRWVGG